MIDPERGAKKWDPLFRKSVAPTKTRREITHLATRRCAALAAMAFLLGSPAQGQRPPHLYDLPDVESRSISAENPTGGKGAGGGATEGFGKDAAEQLGRGWKISPATEIRPGQTIRVADLAAEGVIRHIWMTPAFRPPSQATWRSLILRIYWDDETSPSIEVPLGDFYAMGLGEFAQINSAAVAVNPGAGFNSYWEMPFRKHVRITVENRSRDDALLFYQVDYTQEHLPTSVAYLHAQFHEELQTEGTKPYVLLAGVKGSGQYVGTYMTYGIRHPGWWGEGEIKFYIDGDRDLATIVGTGTEDYFGGAWDFIPQKTHEYQTFTGLYSGLPQIVRPEDSGNPIRFSLYRWHIPDPIRFKSDLKVTIQMLGWTSSDYSKPRKYDPLHEHVSSVAFWYQTEPHQPFPPLPPDAELNVR